MVDGDPGLAPQAPSFPPVDSGLATVPAVDQTAIAPVSREEVSDRGGYTRGLATWYGKEFHGQKMANGDRFDQWDMTTAAANRWPLGTRLEVTYGSRDVQVTVTDRGNFHHMLDLSRGAFRALTDGNESIGVIEVEVREIGDPE